MSRRQPVLTATDNSAALRPGAFTGIDPLPFFLLGLIIAVAAAGAAFWLGGTLAEWATGHSWHPPRLTGDFYSGLMRGNVGRSFPDVPAAAVYAVGGTLFGLVLLLIVVAGVRMAGRRVRPGDPLASLASRGELTRVTLPGLAGEVGRLRPSLAAVKPRDLPPEQLGVPLGTLLTRRAADAPPLRSSWEDVLLAMMAPRAGKTTGLAVPAIVDAPGAVVSTSNKGDAWAATVVHRATLGSIWTFDPQRIVFAGQTWWWNPLAGIRGVEDAQRLAGHFMASIDSGDGKGGDFWSKAALELLTGLILAAASKPGGTMSDVYEWLADSGARAPVAALNDAGHQPSALALKGMQGGAPETREGVFQTARTAAQALRDPTITAWVTPQPAGSEQLACLDPEAFAVSTDALYLLSKDGAGSAAPLVAALTDAVFRGASRVAERRGGRLDPPLLAVLDEAANICRIKDLPDLYSHLGSRGIIPITILQSYRQGVRVWGEPGMDALWSAATIKLIGAGIDDAKTAEDISRLIGDHSVATDSITRTRDGVTHSTNLQRQRILAADQVRALPKGTALLFATGTRAALLRLTPWYAGEHAAVLERGRQAAETELIQRAERDMVNVA